MHDLEGNEINSMVKLVLDDISVFGEDLVDQNVIFDKKVSFSESEKKNDDKKQNFNIDDLSAIVIQLFFIFYNHLILPFLTKLKILSKKLLI